MPSQLATLIIILFIGYLFWVDTRKSSITNKALWIPLIWMLLGGSRFASQWLTLGAPLEETPEGSPMDAAVFFILILAGVIILMRRRINWRGLFKQNVWIWLYFCLGAVSILWSEFPFICVKRLVKAFGNVIMVLVILTEERPYESLGVILRRFTFLLVPLSVLFIKYYPALGRTYHMGMPMLSGVATQKNGLGQICLISTIYFSWSLLLNRRNGIELGQVHHPTHFIILVMVVWLFNKVDSATSNACAAIAVCLFFVGRQSVMIRQPTRIFYLIISGILIIGSLEWLFGISRAIITMLGRSPDLTTRVPMWADLITMVKNPILGFGYESFWLGARREFIYNKYGVNGQAHNGYLETYLNMGLVGLFFLANWIQSGLRKINHHLSIDYAAGVLRLCFVVVVLIYNWTEATLHGVSNMWIILLLGVMDAQTQHSPNKLPNIIKVQGFAMPRTRRRNDSPKVGTKNSSVVKKLSYFSIPVSKGRR